MKIKKTALGKAALGLLLVCGSTSIGCGAADDCFELHSALNKSVGSFLDVEKAAFAHDVDARKQAEAVLKKDVEALRSKPDDDHDSLEIEALLWSRSRFLESSDVLVEGLQNSQLFINYESAELQKARSELDLVVHTLATTRCEGTSISLFPAEPEHR